MEERGGRSGFLGGFLCGALIGAAAAMFAAPAGRMPGVGDALLERGREVLARARARLDAAIAEGRDAAERQQSELLDRG